MPVMLKVFVSKPLAPKFSVGLPPLLSLSASLWGFLPALGPSLAREPSGRLGWGRGDSPAERLFVCHAWRSWENRLCIFRCVFRPCAGDIYKPDSGVQNLQEHPWWGVSKFNVVVFPSTQGTFQWHQFNGTGGEQKPLGLTRKYFLGRNFLTARFGVFLVWFVLFFNRKKWHFLQHEIFCSTYFFIFLIFCLENTNHILFWVRLI